MLIVNADDFGRTRAETDVALSVYRQGRITSVSAMVFMEDSTRAADLAKDAGIDVGLHINFIQGFTGKTPSERLLRPHDRIRRFLSSSKYALLLYDPALRNEFSLDFQAQLDEFYRLYGKPPSHFDGHHHMHLCTNMLLNRAIPYGSTVRRNFSFWPGEKSFLNRSFRYAVDAWLARWYRLTDFFFALPDFLAPGRKQRIRKPAGDVTIELMTHPVWPEELACLMSDEYLELTENWKLAHSRAA